MMAVKPEPLHEGGHLVTFAKDQPPYSPLPASVDSEGTVMTEWELTADELQTLFTGGRIRLWLLYTHVNHPTDPRPLTPVKLEVVK